jgi:hypothetical protein
MSTVEIFEKAAVDLEKALERSTDNEGVFLKAYKSVRSKAMDLEELARFYTDLPDAKSAKRMQEIKVITKDLEDRLGELGELDELYALNGAAELKLKRSQAVREAMAWIEEHDSLIADLHRAIMECELPEGEANRAYVRERMLRKLTKLNRAIDKGDYYPSKGAVYTALEMEDRAHQFRRDLRRISIFMSVTGQFELREGLKSGVPKADALIAKHAKLKDHPIAKTPYAKLSPPKTENPILVPRELFLYLTLMIENIGVVKDDAIYQHMLHEMGIAKRPADLEKLSAEVIPLIEEISADSVLNAMALTIEKN